MRAAALPSDPRGGGRGDHDLRARAWRCGVERTEKSRTALPVRCGCTAANKRPHRKAVQESRGRAVTDYVAAALQPAAQVTAMTINEFLGRDFPAAREHARAVAGRGIARAYVRNARNWQDAGRARRCLGCGLWWWFPELEGTTAAPSSPHRRRNRAGDIQERFSNIRSVSELEPEPDFLRIAAADTFRDGLPNLNNKEAQQRYADVIGNADLVIVDNLSTLCPTIKENDAELAGRRLWSGSYRCDGRTSRCC